jgi:hypothetical protein
MQELSEKNNEQGYKNAQNGDPSLIVVSESWQVKILSWSQNQVADLYLSNAHNAEKRELYSATAQEIYIASLAER